MSEDGVRRLEIFSRIAQIIGGMAAPARLMILQLLSQKPRSVEELALATQLSVANTSQHLQRLARVGIVKSIKNGRSHVYQITNENVLKTWLDLQDLAHRVDPWLDRAEAELAQGLPSIDLEEKELRRKLKSNEVVLLDVRSDDEVEFSPIPNATAMGGGRIKKEYSQLPKRKPIYVVCRGRYCPEARDSVAFLIKKGYNAFRLSLNPARLRNLK